MGGFLSNGLRVIGALGCAAMLAACSGPETPSLLNLGDAGSEGPDEFSILPAKPLEMPENLAALPRPTPGGANRTDPTPQADAIVALGGRPSLLNAPASDAGLIGYTTRYGVDPSIRNALAAADLEYRRENDGRLLERIFNVNVYFNAYEPFELDQRRELERFRASGVWTPAVPPELAE